MAPMASGEQQSASGHQGPAKTERQRWMAVLARATTADLTAILVQVDRDLAAGSGYERLKGPETGTVMIEARAGGAGQRFNAGEATVTRAVVRLADGTLGFCYALGTDRRKAEAAALLDALLLRADAVSADVSGHVARLGETQAARRRAASVAAARTKVDFFTVTRGHD